MNDNKLITLRDDNTWQPILPGDLERIGDAANQAASRHRFADYRQRRAMQTLRRQKADLALFSDFLRSVGFNSGFNLGQEPEAWRGITWGLVEAFIKWQLKKGYAVTTVNVRLSTIKTYARLAMQSGCLEAQNYALIKSVYGYTHKEQQRIDQRRPVKRLGPKKANSIVITFEQAQTLKTQSNTPQGRRDSLMMCLLLDHGLRVGEVSLLTIEMFVLDKGLLRFYRPKVAKVQTHMLSQDTLRAAQAYLRYGDMPRQGPLLRRSKKDETLTDAGMTERAITQRVKILGEKIGVIGLSAHDCRHYWATSAARGGTDPFSLQEAGGWASLAMPRRYIEDNDISNEGIILDEEGK